MTEQKEIKKEKVLEIYSEALKSIRKLQQSGASKTEITNDLERIVKEVVDNED